MVFLELSDGEVRLGWPILVDYKQSLWVAFRSFFFVVALWYHKNHKNHSKLYPFYLNNKKMPQYKAKTTHATMSIRIKIYSYFDFEPDWYCGMSCFCIVLQNKGNPTTSMNVTHLSIQSENIFVTSNRLIDAFNNSTIGL